MAEEKNFPGGSGNWMVAQSGPSPSSVLDILFRGFEKSRCSARSATPLDKDVQGRDRKQSQIISQHLCSHPQRCYVKMLDCVAILSPGTFFFSNPTGFRALLLRVHNEITSTESRKLLESM
jgi:hypothetical protein